MTSFLKAHRVWRGVSGDVTALIRREKRICIELCTHNTNEKALYLGLCIGSNNDHNQSKQFD